MREEAFLNAGLRIQTVDLRPGQEQEDDMCYEGGMPRPLSTTVMVLPGLMITEISVQ